MRIGYACLTIGVAGTNYRTCLQKNASDAVLSELIRHNLAALSRAIAYNRRNDIRLFRITSDLIPFGSSPVNRLDWQTLFAAELDAIGRIIRESGMRVSMHPGQYTVLNSPRPDVYRRAIEDLVYHNKVLDSLGLDKSHKIIVHIGGRYQDKDAAMARFGQGWRLLEPGLRQRLVIENDDKIFSVQDVFGLGRKLGIPVVFDNLHHMLNHEASSPELASWIEQCRETWTADDGPQKIHYSQQDPARKGGSHSVSIALDPFLQFCREAGRDDLDIMLEVKDKNRSAIKCQLALANNPRRHVLEREWGRYKYTILAHAPDLYLTIRQLMKKDGHVPVVSFYEHVAAALSRDVLPGQAVNAAMHVWGYFKDKSDDHEKKAFLRAIERYRSGSGSLKAVKDQLFRLTVKYEDPYLSDSYYFDLE